MSERRTIDEGKLSPLPLRMGCAALICLGLALVLVVVGLFITWHAADQARFADEVSRRGRLVTVAVTGKDVTRSGTGVNRPRTTQFWLEVTPVGEGPAAEGAAGGRLAVSRSEHNAAAVGDRLDVWRIDDRYVLDRVVSNPTSPVIGYALLGAGSTALAIAVTLALVIVRRVKRAADRAERTDHA